MNIKRAKEEIRHTVRLYLEKDEDGQYRIPLVRQRPVLLIGAPGIGKTAIMEQIARECQIALVSYTMTHHTRQSALGLPFIREREYGGKTYSITEYTMSEILASVYERMEATGQREGILFLDEINCVSETLAPMMLQFLQTKTFGNTRLPEGWVIVTAGNPPEYNRSVRDFDVATLDRVKHMRVEADYRVWKEYALEHHIHGSILSYLEHKKEHFYQIETTVDGKRFVTARGWEDLSVFLYGCERLGFPVDGEAVESYLQDRKVAMDFANYLELYRKYEKNYQVADILSGQATDELRTRLLKAPFDERISMITLLLSGLQEGFLSWQEQERYTEELFAWLKEYKIKLEILKKEMPEKEREREGKAEGKKEGEQEYAADAMNTVLLRAEEALEQERAGGLLSRAEEKRREAVLSVLQRYLYQLREMWGKLSGETYKAACEGEQQCFADAFETVRKWFEEELAVREEESERVGSQLEQAFCFLEQCFCTNQGNLEAGPEMVYFVTELESSYAALEFIREIGSEAFYRYIDVLFTDQRRKQLLSEIKACRRN